MTYKYGQPLSAELVAAAEASAGPVSVIMGSHSDWNTVKPCCDVLEEFQVPFEYGVVSAHRTHERLFQYVPALELRGVKVLITCAGGSSHLQGMSASMTIIPVLGFGPTSSTFGPMDVIGSCVRMPSGVPLPFMGLDDKGAKNAALEALRILALADPELRARYKAWVEIQTNSVPFRAHD